MRQITYYCTHEAALARRRAILYSRRCLLPAAVGGFFWALLFLGLMLVT